MSRHRKGGLIADILIFLTLMGLAILVGVLAILLMVHT